MSTGMFVLIALAGVVALVLYCQIGWLLTSHWREQNPHKWVDVGQFFATVFWPLGIIVIYVIAPAGRAFLWAVTAPQRKIKVKRGRREMEAYEASRRREREEREARERAAAEAESPVAKIAKINDDLVRLETQRAELLARKTELERRPDAARA